MQSVPITTNVVSSNPTRYNIDYVIKFVSDLRHVVSFLQGIPVSSTDKTDCHDISEILLKVALNTIMITPNSLIIHGYSIVIVEVKQTFILF